MAKILEQAGTQTTSDGGFFVVSPAIDPQLFELERLADPQGFDTMLAFADATADRQRVVRRLGELYVGDAVEVEEDTARYNNLFAGATVYDDERKQKQLRAQGQRLCEKRHELADLGLTIISGAAMLWSDMSAYFLQRNSDTATLELGGVIWRFEQGYVVDLSVHEAVPVVHGAIDHWADYRRILNGGNTPRERDQIKAHVASANDSLGLLTRLDVVRQHYAT